MSFSIVHAYAIEALDTHDCHVNEYVQEFSQPLNNDMSDDVCNIHYEFHTAFILPESVKLSQKIVFSEARSRVSMKYDFSSFNDLLRPPKN